MRRTLRGVWPWSTTTRACRFLFAKFCSTIRGDRPTSLTFGITLCLGVAGVMFAQWRAARLSTHLGHSLTAGAIPVPSATPALSKEYIYAGSKRVATETPTSDQTITFGSIADKTNGDAAFSVSASSTSGLTVSFSIVSGPAGFSVATVTITGAGALTVRASQAGNSSFNAARNADQGARRRQNRIGYPLSLDRRFSSASAQLAPAPNPSSSCT